jgi:hypothetical protein
VLYVAWWYVLANQWQKGIERWTQSVAAKGWTVTTGDRTVSGFPGRIRIDLAAPEAHDAAGNAWSAPPSRLSISLFAPLEPGFDASGTHHVTVAGHAPIEVTADSVTGQIGVADGKPASLTVEGRHVAAGETAAQAAGGGVLVDALHLDLRRLPPGGTNDATAPVVALVVGVEGLAPPEGIAPVLDRTIAAAHLALRLRGAIPPGPPNQALAAWRDAGGTLEIDSFDLDWPPIVAAGNATLALDKDLQPELAGTVTVRGLPVAIDRAVDLKLMKPGAAIAAKVVLGLAAKQGTDGQPENKVAITVQNRQLAVGPIKLLQVPAVVW